MASMVGVVPLVLEATATMTSDGAAFDVTEVIRGEEVDVVFMAGRAGQRYRLEFAANDSARMLAVYDVTERKKPVKKQGDINYLRETARKHLRTNPRLEE